MTCKVERLSTVNCDHFLSIRIPVSDQNWKEGTKPLVTISCITYNHASYIHDALEGFLMQKTTFPIEILIHDDASTDGTADIVRDYEKKYPKLILPIYQSKNQYSKGVKISSTYQFPRARGKYIAMCEGDDYWTDPLKLQKQVDFLEAHPECSMCFHDVMVIADDGACVSLSYNSSSSRQIYTLDDILEKCFPQTCSVMFKNNLILAYPDWFYKIINGDWALYVLLAQQGNIGYIEEKMACHRLHTGGVWSPLSDVHKLKQLLPLYGTFYKHVGQAHGVAIRAGASTIIAA
ncbi:MAG TPA: glycosyltransferase [Chloroflexi bacterium]|nr:glycosyltransferase [Chloroflexota bacterium]